MTHTEPTIDHILTTFFAEQTDCLTGLARTRVLTVAESLRRCVEQFGESVLIDNERTLLAAERVFDPEVAIATLTHADDLLYLLAIFVEHERLPAQAADVRVHLRMCERLTKWITRRRLVYWDEVNCALYDIEARVRQARIALKSADAATRRR